MKYLLLIISLLMVTLIGIKATGTVLPVVSQTSSAHQYAHSIDESAPLNQSFSSSNPERSFCDMSLPEACTLARHLTCSSNRFSRTATHYHIFCNKFLLRRMSMLMESLEQHTTSLFSTMPHISWAVSSEHYVFGMCRILI